MILAKLGGEIAGATTSAVVGIFAVSDNTALTVTAITAVLGFAGLLVRQVVVAQKAIWQIVSAKDARIAELEETDHYKSWEMEKLRFTYGERILDPGPYIPRKPAGAAT